MTTQEWEVLLTAELGRPVAVKYGRARTAPVQGVFEPDRARLRLHEFFRAAPASIRADLAAWLRSGRRARRACARLDAWIDAQLAALPRKPARRPPLRPRGDCYDLVAEAAPLFAVEFRQDFLPLMRPGLTWGRRAPSRARRSLTLGSYERETNIVRIHPVLDRETVPIWFVRYVLFHEILHAALPGTDCAGRHRPHGPAFQARERAYPDYDRAVRWQRRHLPGLIRAARR